MSIDANPWVPDDDRLKGIGRVTICHGHLEHALKVSLKRMLDVSLDDPKYHKEVGKLMAKDLRIEIRRQLAIKLGGGSKSEVQPMKTEVLDQMLDHTEKLTTERNRYTHGNWVISDETGPIIRDRNFETKQLETYAVPSIEELTKLASECEAMATMFDGLTSVWLHHDRAGD